MDFAIFATICFGVIQSYTIISVFVESTACVCVWRVHTHVIMKDGGKPIRYHVTT